MKIFNNIGIKIVATVMSVLVLPIALPANTPVAGAMVGASSAQAQDFDNWRQRGRHNGDRIMPGARFGDRDRYDRGNRSYGRDRYYGRDGYDRDNRFYRRHNNNGAAIAGAVIGLGLGAAIIGANQPRAYRAAPAYGAYQPRTPAWYRYCSARYRSFDAQSGTFQPNNGPRQLCR